MCFAFVGKALSLSTMSCPSWKGFLSFLSGTLWNLRSWRFYSHKRMSPALRSQCLFFIISIFFAFLFFFFSIHLLVFVVLLLCLLLILTIVLIVVCLICPLFSLLIATLFSWFAFFSRLSFKFFSSRFFFDVFFSVSSFLLSLLLCLPLLLKVVVIPYLLALLLLFCLFSALPHISSFLLLLHFCASLSPWDFSVFASPSASPSHLLLISFFFFSSFLSFPLACLQQTHTARNRRCS